MVLDTTEVDVINSNLKKSEMLAGEKMNSEKLLSLRLGREGKYLPPESIFDHWTSGAIKLVGIRLGSDFYADRKRVEVTS